MYYTQCLLLPPLTSIIMDRHKQTVKEKGARLFKHQRRTNYFYNQKKKSDHKKLVTFLGEYFTWWKKKNL